MEDKLDLIFKFQAELQEKLGNLKKIRESPAMKQQFINQMCLAEIEETIEALKETPYKNPNYMPFGWKIGQQGNRERYLKELADKLHFLVNLCHAEGITSDELFDAYLDKNKENHLRKETGY